MLYKRKFLSAQFATIYLAFFWTLFLAAGIWIGELTAGTAVPSSPCLFISDSSCKSIIVFRSVSLISSLILIQLEVQWGIWIIASLRGISYGFLIGSTYTCFGDAGWLVCLLYYFSESFCVVVELWFWARLLSTDREKRLRTAFVSFALVYAFTLIDSLHVSSFTSVLMQ